MRWCDLELVKYHLKRARNTLRIRSAVNVYIQVTTKHCTDSVYSLQVIWFPISLLEINRQCRPLRSIKTRCRFVHGNDAKFAAHSITQPRAVMKILQEVVYIRATDVNVLVKIRKTPRVSFDHLERCWREIVAISVWWHTMRNEAEKRRS